MKDWERDKKWTDDLLPHVKRILGEHLIGQAPHEEDAKRNTDLIVLKLDAVRIACRIRTYKYYLRYPDEFTIRVDRPSGMETELTKILKGWGNYFFYGFSDDGKAYLVKWTLGDLNAFRIWFQRQTAMSPARVIPGTLQRNHDGSSDFRAFKVCEVPDFVIADGESPPAVASRQQWQAQVIP